MIRHFLDLDVIAPGDLRRMIDSAKTMHKRRDKPLQGKALALLFEKPSTRTRISFELAMKKLGGDTVVLERDSTQLGRGETIADTARVLSGYVDCIMLRTTSERKLLELAEYASVPVINGLTDRTHPCQLMADVMTYEETRGPIAGARVAWVGDGNNMATSWIHAAAQFGFSLRVACPPRLAPPAEVLAWAKQRNADVTLEASIPEAVRNADCVVTDTWVSMGDEDNLDRREALRPYCVTSEIMALAKRDAIFLHCLPAHRGEEVTGEVIDSRQSLVWREAANRLPAQQAILEWCLLPS
ncbi:MAG TPA: ornithine carbamoyltransferase [Dongiaceae bacterium]|jgi:ornithine carbamoyltransferase|nr:ornithine carbamoyltransferase [Dongiaceae bacterium]